jgi:hypothetical protein
MNNYSYILKKSLYEKSVCFREQINSMMRFLIVLKLIKTLHYKWKTTDRFGHFEDSMCSVNDLKNKKR